MSAIHLSKIGKHYLKQQNKIETLFCLIKGQYSLVTSKTKSF